MSGAENQVRDFISSEADSSTETSFTSETIDEFLGYYDKESFEVQLLEMENALINNTEDKINIVQGVFRDMHSLKGSSAMLKIDPLTHLLHNLEDVLGVISNNASRITAVKRTDCFDFFLQAFDLIDKITFVFHDDPKFILKNNRELFGFYIRLIVESRTIASQIDQYMELGELDDDMF